MRRYTDRIAIALAFGLAISAGTPRVGAFVVTSTVLGATREGRPTIKLDRLDFPDVPGAPGYEKHLRRELRRATRRADWGAGRGAEIEYRFAVQKLELIRGDGVLRVRCRAVGRLPKGKTAKSELSFGGSPKHEKKLVRQVLEIVARGVITRLAEMERLRRSGR